MTKQCELSIISNDLTSLKEFGLQQQNSESYSITVDLKRIKKISLLEKSVLIIQFQNGEISLDLTKKELDKINYEE